MSAFAKLHAWWAHLWSHAVQGTLPDVPQANQPVTFPHIVTVTPPAPALPDTHTTPPVQAQPPAHISPAPPAGATGTDPGIDIPPVGLRLPPGVKLVDEVNGLVSIDPVRYNNPDCAGQLFCVEPTLAFVDAESQAAYTIRQNVADALSAERGLGFHPRVRPMVATGDSRKFEYAPVVIGPVDRVPWLDNAWTITGGTFDDVLAKVSSGQWHKPTNTGANPHGHVPSA